MKNKNRAGYTVIELMIVLAVTSVTAVSAFTLVRGQQAKNEFSQAVRDFEAKISDITSDVANGYFPDLGASYTCTANDGAGLQLSTNNASTNEQQGSSNDCVFAGKALKFEETDEGQQMVLSTLAARRMSRDDKNVTALDDLESGDMAVVPVLDEPMRLLHGLRARSVRYNGNTGHDTVAFLSGFGNRKSSTSNLSGSPETNLFWLTSSATGCAASANAALANPNCYQPPTDSDGIIICLEHGADGRRARVSLGRNGNALNITTEIDAEC